MGIKRLNYIEFREVGKCITKRSLSRAIQDAIYLEELDQALRTPIPSRNAGKSSAAPHAFAVRFGGDETSRVFILRSPVETAETPYCRIEIDLGTQDFLLLTRLSEVTAPPSTMTVLNHMRSSITRKLPELETVTVFVTNTTAA